MANSPAPSVSSAQGSSQPPASSPSDATTSDTTPTTSSSSSSVNTNTPTTSAAPTTTPASGSTSTPNSSPAAGQTTNPSQATSTAVASGSTAAASSLSTSSFTSQVATTFFSTNPGGSVVYITTSYPEIVSTPVSTGSHSGTSHTGVIVGSAVGGVVGLALLTILLFCIRKRVRSDEFDGNFDPDRVVGRNDESGGTLPRVDFVDEVTPFPQPYADPGNGTGSMRQYGETPYLALASSPSATSGQLTSEFYAGGAAAGMGLGAQQRPYVSPASRSTPPSGAYNSMSSVNMYGAGPTDWHNPRPAASPPPSTVSNQTSSARAAKEREAAGRDGQGAGLGLGLATQPEAGEGSGEVVVHQDAGRAPIEEPAPPREIPPSYDSIQQD